MSQELTPPGTEQGDLLHGSSGDDTLSGLGGNDTLYGRDGADFLDGGDGDDLLHGGRGADGIFLGPGSDTAYGGDGADAIFYRGQSLIFAGTGDDFVSVEFGYAGAAGRAEVDGGAGNDALRAGLSQTWLRGGSGNDSLWGSQGQDTLQGDGGADDIFFTANDVVIGGRGNDRIFLGDDTAPDAAAEFVFHSGDGHDTVYTFNPNVTLTFADETQQSLRVTAGPDSSLVLLHGDGDWVRLIGAMNEEQAANLPTTLQLADGVSISLEQLVTSQVIRLSAGDDWVHFPMGWDERIAAGRGDDGVFGHDGDDSLFGQGGNDTLSGGDGNNLLKGGAGDDLLMGGRDGDTLIGGAGNDTLVCGEGVDQVLLNSALGSDLVSNFAFAEDRLVLSQSQLGAIGDGDRRLEGATVRAEAGGFATSAELVQFSTALAGLDAQQAADAIGAAQQAYAEGQSALFLVNDGWNAALYRFESSAVDATVSADELTLLVELSGHTSADPAAFWLAA